MPEHQTIYLEIPLAEFEHLHDQIKRLQAANALLEEQRDAYVALAQRVQTDMRDRERELLSEIKKLETEVAGYRWGLSNAEAEEHDIRES